MLSHTCDYRDSDGTTTSVCHLLEPHGGRCPECGFSAAGCPHQSHWELVLLCPVLGCEIHR